MSNETSSHHHNHHHCDLKWSWRRRFRKDRRRQQHIQDSQRVPVRLTVTRRYISSSLSSSSSPDIITTIITRRQIAIGDTVCSLILYCFQTIWTSKESLDSVRKFLQKLLSMFPNFLDALASLVMVLRVTNPQFFREILSSGHWVKQTNRQQ